MAYSRMRQEGSVVGAANTAVTIALGAPAAGYRNLLRAVHWSYSDDPTAVATLEIYENVTERVLSIGVTKGGPGFLNFPGEGWLTAQSDHDVTVTLAPGGANIAGRLNVIWDVIFDEVP